jgi:hypothetical protein
MKNSASTFWASRTGSKEACATNHKVGTGTSYVEGLTKRKNKPQETLERPDTKHQTAILPLKGLSKSNLGGKPL